MIYLDYDEITYPHFNINNLFEIIVYPYGLNKNQNEIINIINGSDSLNNPAFPAKVPIFKNKLNIQLYSWIRYI